MIDKRTTEYLEKFKAIGMDPKRRLRMREELGAFADFHGVRIAENGRSIDEVQNTSVLSLFIHSHTRIMKATLLMALMVTVGGGTSFAAQNALPGDALYPVKLHVNENIRTAFAFDANTQAEVQLALLNERIQEAKTLSGEGELHGEVEAEVLANIAAQVDKTAEAANKADAEVGADVRLAIDSNLSLLSTRLAVVPSSHTDGYSRTQADASQSMSLKYGMGGGDDADVMTMSAIGTELAGEISIASIVEQAQSRLTALQMTLKNAFEMSAEIKAGFEAQLKTAGDLVLNAQTSLKAGAEAKAEEQAQKAHEIMGEVESALSLMGSVKIDGNGHIIDIDLGGNTSSGAGVSGSAGTAGSIAPDIMIGNDAAADTVIDAEAQGSTEGSFGF